MNLRRQKYKANRLAGMSAYKAAVAAGYSHNTAINAHKNIESRCDFGEELIKAGLTNDLLAKHALEGLQATKVISANITYGDADEKTNDFIDVPDWNSRHRYYETILKLQGKLKEKIEHSGEIKTGESRIIIVNGSKADNARLPGGAERIPEEIRL